MVQLLESRICLAAATINWNDVHQTVDGFGASSAWQSGSLSTTVANELFSTTSGAGLSLLRSRVAYNGTSPENSIMQQAAGFGVTVWSSTWPPREWKTIADNGGKGIIAPNHYQDMANELADYIQNMQALGVPIYAISLANEPDSKNWTQQTLADYLPYVGQTFAARGITTKIILAEQIGWNFTLSNEVMADPALSQYVGIMAAHDYVGNDPYVPADNALGRPTWLTEMTFNNSTTAPYLSDAITLADNIHQAFTNGDVTGYNYWWYNASDGSGLMNNSVPTKRLWAEGQYARFVRPGWVMTGETDDGGLDVTSFKDPASGKFAVVVVNTGTSTINETYTLNGTTAGSVTPYVTSATDDLAQYSPITLTNGTTFTASIAPGSIVTYTGVSGAAPTLQPPDDVRAAAEYGAGTSSISVTWADNSTAETSETVQRSTDGVNWTTLSSTIAAGTTSYVDTGLSENTSYVYRVRSNNGNTSSAWGPTASAATIIAAPSGVTASAISGGLKVSWTINSAASTGVTVQRSLDGLAWTTIATLNTRATTYSDIVPGYSPNQIYYYRVRNTVGTATSGYASYHTTLLAPTGFTGTVTSPTSVTFTWTNNALGASGAYIQELQGSSWTTVSPSDMLATSGTFALTGLSENTAYSFRMAVESDADSLSSAYANTISLTTPVAAPTNLTAISTAAGTAVLNWTDNSAVETAYGVERSADGSTWTVLTSTLAAGTTTYTDTAAPTTGNVYYRVKAIASSASSAYVRTQMVAGVPVVTAAATVTGTTTTLAATAPSGFGSGALTYTWSLDGTPPGPVTFSANGTATATTTVATFTAAGSYVFRVTINDTAGDSTTGTGAVKVVQTATTVGVQDKSAQASYGGPQEATPSIATSTWEQLAATAYDQFGTALATQPTFTWSVVSGGGSVTSAGLYAAPAGAASPVVKATTGSASGTIVLSVIATPQPTSDYSFNETGGYDLADTGSAGVTATMSGGASIVKGRMGNGVSFDGASGSVYLGNVPQLDIRGQITLSAWIKPNSTTGTQTIVGRGYGSWPNYGGTFLRIANGQYQVGYYSGSYHVATYAMPSSDVGKWVHLVGTYNGKNWNLYRDGTLVATMAAGTGATYANVAWRVGSSDIPADYFNGDIDDVRLYGQALSASQVASLYNQAITITAAARANPATTTTNTSTLSVAAVDPDSGSDSQLTYTWVATSLPAGAAAPTFSVNGSSAARSTVATFTKSGLYQFTVTVADSAGIVSSVTSSTSVVVQFGDGPAPTVATAAAATPNPVTGTTTALSVLGADAAGESSLNYYWASSGPATVSFLANGTNAAKNTLAVFNAPGAYTFTVTVVDGGGLAATSSVNVNVVPTLTTVNVSPNVTTVSAGATQQFTASGLDQFGNAIAATYTWSIGSGTGSVSGSGLFTAPASQGGLVAVKASSGSASGIAVVTVPQDNTDTANVAYVGTWASGTSVSGYLGTNYSYGNYTNSSATYTTVIPVAGLYAVYDRWTSSTSRAADVPVTVASSTGGTLGTMTVDQTSNGGVWNLMGTYSFAAGATGSLKISTPGDAASNRSTIADGVEFVLVQPAPTVVNAAAASPNPVTGTTAALTVLGGDAAGESGLTYTWATTGTPPAPVGFGANGTNAAKNTLATFSAAGRYTFAVTITDAAGLAASSTVSVTVAQTLTSVTVTPATATVASGGTVQFAAAGNDQFGNVLAAQPQFAFATATGSVGSITSAGLYSAPSSGYGSATVVATASGVSGTAAVTVLSATAVSLVNNGPATSNATQALSFTATVGGGVPDGSTVTLLDASKGNAVVATGTTSAGVATLTVPAGTLLAGAHNLVASYAGGGVYAPNQSAVLTQTVQVVVTAVTVNGNLPALVGAQRSMVDSVVYTFSEPVTAGANAFAISLNQHVTGGAIGTLPTLTWTALNPTSGGAATQWVLTFSGSGVVGSSIANGVYDIAVNAAAVTAAANAAVSAQARATDTFYRLFGDSTGDGRVNNADNNAYLTTYGLRSGMAGYLAAFDYDGDGRVNNTDNNYFLADYGLRYSGFTATI